VLPWHLLGVGATTIAECSMLLGVFLMQLDRSDTTICSVSDPCIMKCRLLFDLLLDDVKRVHLFTPESRGCLIPVPSVVCVLVIKAMGFSMLNPSSNDIELFCRGKQSSILNTFPQPLIVLTPKKIFRWDVHKENSDY